MTASLLLSLAIAHRTLVSHSVRHGRSDKFLNSLVLLEKILSVAEVLRGG